MRGDHSAGALGCYTHGSIGRKRAYEAVDDNGHAILRGADEKTHQPGNVEPAELGEHIYWVICIGGVYFKRTLDSADFALESSIR